MDDQGLDASAQYNLATDLPDTPNINQLATQGITFDNMRATPACSTTRATIITGKYGMNSGVNSVPGNLSSEHVILQKYLKSNVETEEYQSAVFGKWHIGANNGDSHPNDVGLEHYAGNLSNLTNYYDWSLTSCISHIDSHHNRARSLTVADNCLDYSITIFFAIIMPAGIMLSLAFPMESNPFRKT